MIMMDTDIVKSVLSYKSKDNSLLVDIVIDKLTPCLEHRLSGEMYDTEVRLLTKSDLPELSEWGFQWKNYFSVEFKSAEIYKLIIKGQDRIEGIVFLEDKKDHVFVHLVENAPWNIGGNKKEFLGVGAHLFAIACRQSLDLGYDGYVAFDAKTDLIKHYQEELAAELYGRRRMIIDDHAAHLLIEKYMKQKG